ncbi:MAG TPA: hypothetical protein VNU44_20440 [Bryobacteraceae bacterium]|jgi:hypothetical protein|nr:hypothetical protein [Bryobacteraceae bacterium]
MTVTAEHEQLLALASRVPEDQIPTAKRMLEALIVDPFWLSFASAPMDDEELTPEAAASILEAEQAVGRGESTSHEEMLREFGLI